LSENTYRGVFKLILISPRFTSRSKIKSYKLCEGWTVEGDQGLAGLV